MTLMSRKNKSAQLGAVKAPNVIFGTLVRDVNARVIAEQGMVVLKVEGESAPYFLPEGVVLDHQYFGEELTVTIRGITGEVILELGEDDIYEEDLAQNSKLIPVDNWHEVKELFNEQKIQAFTRNAKALSTFIAGIVLTAVSGWLCAVGDFPYPIIPILGIPLGIFLSIGCGLLPTIGLIKQLNTDVIWDGAGNWINVETGETNLNGGTVIKIN